MSLDLPLIWGRRDRRLAVFSSTCCRSTASILGVGILPFFAFARSPEPIC